MKIVEHCSPGRLAPRRAGAAGPRRCGDAGSISVEMVLIYTPVMVLVMLSVVMCVRIASAKSDVNAAAAAGARQASIARSPSGAVAGGRDAAGSILDARSIRCQPRTVQVDASQMAPGGQVAVSIDCRVSLADLSGFGLPGAVTLHADALQVVDTYRGVE